MTSSAKWFLLVLAAFLGAWQTFSSTRARLFRLLPVLALLLGAFSPFAAAPASADVLVSNIEQIVSRSAGAGHVFAYGQGFTTGSDDDGYILESIELDVQISGENALSAIERATIKAQLWSSSNGEPDTSFKELTLPSSIPAGESKIILSAPASTRLSANTEYHLVVFTTGSNLNKFRLSRESSDSEWRFIVAPRQNRDEFNKVLSVLREGNQSWARYAAVLMIAVTQTFREPDAPNRHAVHDLGLAISQMVLQALDRGVYTHQMGGFFPEKAREVYQIPEGFEPYTAIAMGYRAASLDHLDDGHREREAASRQRQELTDMVYNGSWARPAAFLQKGKA